MPHIDLHEWEEKGPTKHDAIDSELELGARSEELIRRLAESDKLELLQLRSGLQVRSTSWVGQVTIGNLSISVQPKIRGLPLVELLRYAYSLRDLHTFNVTDYQISARTFQDLLVAQLITEATDLLSRGLHRDYLRLAGELHSPKGRIDFRKVVSTLSAAKSSVPCIFHNRSEEVLLNRVLLAGLQLASSVATDSGLRDRISRLTRVLELSVSPVRLTAARLVDAQRKIDRRTMPYAASLTLIELILEGIGPSLGEADAEHTVPLPGFMFDMNRFFQSLISRFLRAELTGYSVQDERGLKDLFAFDPNRNPRGRRPRAPRPDFSVMSSGKVVALLDAKYRDLWARELPPDMLYQLAIYALSNQQSEARSTILYPSTTDGLSDQVVQFKDPVYGYPRAEVILRPVNLSRLACLIRSEGGIQAVRQRQRFAHALVFGETASDMRRRVIASTG